MFCFIPNIGISNAKRGILSTKKEAFKTPRFCHFKCQLRHLKRHKFSFKFYEMDPCLLPIQEITTLKIKFSGENTGGGETARTWTPFQRPKNTWESRTRIKRLGPGRLAKWIWWRLM